MRQRLAGMWIVGVVLAGASGAWAEGEMLSCPPLRPRAVASTRPLAEGPARFVDAQRGDDAHDGSESKPWRTLNGALRHLCPGDTLYLRGGSYYENVYVALVGRADAPITLRSYPGEVAILDGGIPRFVTDPSSAWEPFADGAPDEFRSTEAYPNLRDVIGAFGDSMVGLQTYWHPQDLRATNELWDQPKGEDVKPIYVGPGLWYDRDSGRIHVRLAHTHLGPVPNYTGQTDPRKLPLVIAAFDSVPLRLSGAAHVRLQDLEIRGGGYDTVVLQQCRAIEFDNVAIRCGTYGMRTRNVVGLRFYRSALYGNIPPWGFRNENGLRNRKGDLRDIARLTGHALWVTDTGREFSVYAFPLNDDWEISYSEFTDCHDGLYLGGINVRFHHNLVEDMHDDGIYLSPMYPHTTGQTQIYQNLFRRCLTTLAFGHVEVTRDSTLIYRNVFDLRGPVNYQRPSPDKPEGTLNVSRVMGDHGSPPWASMMIYHNTFVAGHYVRSVGMGVFDAPHPDRPRRLFNNIFLHLANMSAYQGPDPDQGIIADGNLFWSMSSGEPRKADQLSESFFAKFRSSPAYEKSKAIYPPGSTTHSLVAQPVFERFVPAWPQDNDYRPTSESPVVDAGVAVPEDWPDPLRELDHGRPDLGALPLGAAPLLVGRSAPEP